MGASWWSARVSYQDDITAALAQARWDAFNRNDFYRQLPNERARSMNEEEYVAWGAEQANAALPPEVAAFVADGFEPDFEEYRDEWRAAQIAVADPDSLLDSQPFSGTHSVIDMTHVADKPDYNAVAPAPDEYLMEQFGTTRPSVEAIEAALQAYRLDGFSRWHGMYLIGHTEDRPEAIFFVGHSGD